MPPAVRFTDVSKRYRLGAQFSLSLAAQEVAARLRGRNVPEDRFLWAMRDVSFTIEPGEMVGIIGHNGAGKSTMLKLLSKVAFPTSGTVEASGRIAAMIELGAGFHPDLSGRDNIYLSGAIQGQRRAEIDTLIDPIVAFAELDRFIDTPVKFYSSGMYARLGFAIAAHVRADILLIDEVLSVGDAAFRRKCLQRIDEMRRQGRTIILVSHDTWSIIAYCTRTMLLSHGQIAADGTPKDVIDLYRQQERATALAKAATEQANTHTGGFVSAGVADFAITDVQVMQPQPTVEIEPMQPFTVRVQYDVRTPLVNPEFGVRVRRMDNQVITSAYSHFSDTLDLRYLQGSGAIEVTFDQLFLMPDVYTLDVELIAGDMPLVLARATSDSFKVRGQLQETSVLGVVYTLPRWQLQTQIHTEPFATDQLKVSQNLL